MLNRSPGSYRELIAQREQVFRSAVANGEIEPFVYPWDTIPAGILILTVLFLPGGTSKYSRWIFHCAFPIIVYLCVSTMQRCRSLGMASGYGIGLMCVWGIVWSAVLLVYNDPKVAFQRVEWRDAKENLSVSAPHVNGSLEPNGQPVPNVRNRRAYGVAGGAYGLTKDKDAQESTRDASHLLVWQPYPEKFRHGLDWVIDLCTSFRGPGWNWHIQTLPAADYPSPSMPSTSSSSMQLLTRIAIRDFLIWYLVADTVKTTMMNDPYFWSIAPMSSKPPNAAYLPSIVITSQTLTKLYRLLLSLAAVTSALSFIFTLCPLFFAFLLPFIKLDQYTRAPLREPLLYPPYWGSFCRSVLDKGLAGWWGIWWHQMFRMGISDPSRFLTEKLGWNPRSQKSRLLQLFIAFGISGAIHAGASYTTFAPETRPLSGSFSFFFSQAFGIVAEKFIFKTMGISDAMQSWPKLLKRAGTLAYILSWFYMTGPLLADDFARSGVWLFEPVPISVVRGLGLGALGEGWWCWHGTWAAWWSGIERTPWWKKGIAI